MMLAPRPLNIKDLTSNKSQFELAYDKHNSQILTTVKNFLKI